MRMTLRHAPLLAATLIALAACGPRPLEEGASTTSATSATTTAAPAIATSATSTATAATAPAPSATSRAAATRGTTASTTASSRSSSTTARAQASASPAAETTVAVYFTQGERLVTESRGVPAAQPARGSLDALLAGPRGADHYSQVPPGTRLLSVSLTAGTATANFSQEVESLQGSPAIPLFLAQVVDTLTQFPDVQHVVLEVNGRPLRSLGGEGMAVPEPLDKAVVQRMLSGT